MGGFLSRWFESQEPTELKICSCGRTATYRCQTTIPKQVYYDMFIGEGSLKRFVREGLIDAKQQPALERMAPFWCSTSSDTKKEGGVLVKWRACGTCIDKSDDREVLRSYFTYVPEGWEEGIKCKSMNYEEIKW